MKGQCGVLRLLVSVMLINHAYAFTITHHNILLAPLCSKCQSKRIVNYHGHLESVLHMSSDEDLSSLPWSSKEDQSKSVQNSTKLDLEKIKSFSKKVIENTKEGDFGSRGEEYFITQAFLVLCILGGGVPFVGDSLKILFGPVLIMIGIVAVASGIYEVGGSLSPFPRPSSNMTLKTSGAFQYMRHPMYAGLLSIVMGGSILSDSASRVILTVALFFVLNAKADFEEVEIEKKNPSYSEYKEQVTGKFVPSQVTDKIASVVAKLVRSKNE